MKRKIHGMRIDERGLTLGSYSLGSLPAPYSGLKAVKTTSGDIHFLMYCLAYLNGTAYNEELEETPLSSAQIYTDIYVRWAIYIELHLYILI